MLAKNCKFSCDSPIDDVLLRASRWLHGHVAYWKLY